MEVSDTRFLALCSNPKNGSCAYLLTSILTVNLPIAVNYESFRNSLFVILRIPPFVSNPVTYP